MSVLGALPAAQKPECELVGAAQAGDLAAFEELADVHADHLYSVVLRLVGDHGDAEDVMQETLLRAWRGVGRFRADASFLPGCTKSPSMSQTEPSSAFYDEKVDVFLDGERQVRPKTHF